MPFGLFDPTMLLLVPAMIFAFWAQWKVTHTYRQYSQVRAANGLTGSQVAKAIMNRNGVTDVAVEEVGGVLSDHYDPRARKVRLSASVFREPSLAALAVGAHEIGHVLQHAQGYAPPHEVVGAKKVLDAAALTYVAAAAMAALQLIRLVLLRRGRG